MPTLQFSVLSYYPSFVTQENINIGLLFYIIDTNEASFYSIRKWDRVRAFDDELDVDFMKDYLKGLSYEVNSGLFSHNIKFDMDQFVKHYINEYKFSRIQTVDCQDVDEFIETTKKVYLKYDYEKHERLKKNQESRYIYQLLRSSNVPYTREKIKGNFNEDIKYDYIIGEHAVKIFNFEGKQLNYIINNIKAWAFNANEMQNVYKTIFIYDVELKDVPLFDAVIEILSKSSYKTLPLSTGIEYLLTLKDSNSQNYPLHN